MNDLEIQTNTVCIPVVSRCPRVEPLVSDNRINMDDDLVCKTLDLGVSGTSSSISDQLMLCDNQSYLSCSGGTSGMSAIPNTSATEDRSKTYENSSSTNDILTLDDLGGKQLNLSWK